MRPGVQARARDSHQARGECMRAAMSASVAIRGQPSFATARAMLEAAGLPVADLSEERLQHFFYLPHEDSAMGLVGLELYAEEALLRSLIVAPSERGQGLGIALVRHAEAYAASQGARSIYLLTLSAELFFQRLGYTRLDRSAAPASIRRTSEFASLCPANSSFMVKVL
jgi:amino-acid N-acetyltransferase